MKKFLRPTIQRRRASFPLSRMGTVSLEAGRESVQTGLIRCTLEHTINITWAKTSFSHPGTSKQKSRNVSHQPRRSIEGFLCFFCYRHKLLLVLKRVLLLYTQLTDYFHFMRPSSVKNEVDVWPQETREPIECWWPFLRWLEKRWSSLIIELTSKLFTFCRITFYR